MALFETKVTFKTYELLCDMLELSNYNFNRSPYSFSYDNVPKFTTGRQTAKTSSIVKYVENHPNEKILVVTHNTNMRDHYFNLLKDCVDTRNLHIGVYSAIPILKGIRFDTVIFDTIDDQQCQKIFAELITNFVIKDLKMVAVLP